MMYEERERQKAAGWRTLADESLPLEQRAAGLLAVIEAHFYRFTEGSRRGRVPKWEDYAGAWLRANGDRIREQEAVAVLRKQYPPPPPKRLWIPPGRSYAVAMPKDFTY